VIKNLKKNWACTIT